MAVRTARTAWHGTLQEGSGQVELSSSKVGTYEVSFPKRTAEQADGTTSPEELIAAAHSACFSMALSNGLNKAGSPPQALDTKADVTFQPGQGIKSIWRKQPIFIRNLTPKEILEANAVPLSALRDPQTLAQRTKPGKANWLITLGVCTHLGCVPLGIGEGENRGPYGGYFCPCHGSMYDTAALIRQGPAPKNLEVPDYKFTGPTTVLIGQKG